MMSNYIVFEQFKDKVKDASSLDTIARRYFEFDNSGKKALCPYHKESSPSFVLHPSKDFFKCFGCGKVADVFELVMHFEGLNFKDALYKLAEENNIEPPHFSANDLGAYSAQKKREEKSQDLLDAVLNILKENSSEGLPYLKSRGISEITGREYSAVETGYISIKSLELELKKLGFIQSELEDSGVLSDTRFFKDSLIIPIRKNGKIATFCSRTTKDRKPKYLYLKGHRKEMFNRDLALTQEEIIITEAPLDALTLIEHGFKGAISVGGCYPSDDQINKINKVERGYKYVCFDNDEDGEAK